MNTALFVDKFYEMNPETDDFISEGANLENGMIVLLEDSMMRGEPDRADPSTISGKYELERVRENNRWCEVLELKVTPRIERDDLGRTTGEGSPLISFVALYSDGTKKKRRYDSSYAWLVKKGTTPGNNGYVYRGEDVILDEPENHECKAEPKIVERDGMLHISCAECGDHWTTPKL